MNGSIQALGGSDAPASDSYLAGRIVSVSPLVTISTPSRKAPLGIASVATTLFEDRPALHLLHHSWTLDEIDAEWLATSIANARKDSPNSHFVFLASNDLESINAGAAGAPAILGSALIFLDERVWRPVAPPAGSARYDAVYVGRLDRMKRHELAARTKNVLLIYSHTLDQQEDPLPRLRGLLPNAYFANHEIGGGKYALLDHERIAGLLGQSDVGLCLSAVEGCMRASMEYLLSGLPVVSTKSIGGRDRYFVGGYCKVVEDDPDEVARAVRELRSLNFDRSRIRDHVAQLIAFDRHNFLLAVNNLVRSHFGMKDRFSSISPFIGSLASYEKASDVLEGVKATLAAKGQG